MSQQNPFETVNNQAVSTTVGEPAVAETDFDFASATVDAPNADKDYNTEMPPPPEGEYRLRVGLAEQKFDDNGKEISPLRRRVTNEGKAGKHEPYLSVNMTIDVIDEGKPWNDMRVFYRGFPSTMVGKFNGTSIIHDLMYKIGQGLDSTMPFVEMENRIREALSKNPTVKGYIKWAATRRLNENEKGNNNNYFGSYVLVDGMDKFPMDETGTGHLNYIMDNGEKYWARGFVTQFLND